MKEIKAFIRQHRIADVIDALKKYAATQPQDSIVNVNITPIESFLKAADSHEQHYSMELAQPVVHEHKLELLCEDAQVSAIIKIIAAHARTGQAEACWIVVLNVEQAVCVGSG